MAMADMEGVFVSFGWLFLSRQWLFFLARGILCLLVMTFSTPLGHGFLYAF
jgi:hypothetical protein